MRWGIWSGIRDRFPQESLFEDKEQCPAKGRERVEQSSRQRELHGSEKTMRCGVAWVFREINRRVARPEQRVEGDRD